MIGITALIGAGLGLASSIYGAINSAQHNKRSQNLIDAQRRKNAQWYEQEMSRDYMNRQDTQAVLKKQKEMLDEYYNRAASASAVTGSTDEAAAQAKAAANKTLENTMTNIAANSAAYKDNIGQQYRSKDDLFNQQQSAIEAQRSQQISQAAGQAVNAGLSLVGTSIGTPISTPIVEPVEQSTPEDATKKR